MPVRPLLVAAAAAARLPGQNGAHHVRLASGRAPGHRRDRRRRSDGTDLLQLTSHLQSSTDPAWSPDGERIALTCRVDLLPMDADGANETAITGVEGVDWAPA